MPVSYLPSSVESNHDTRTPSHYQSITPFGRKGTVLTCLFSFLFGC